MRLVDDPDERLFLPPAEYCGCGKGLDVGYGGVIVRGGYGGYSHLASAARLVRGPPAQGSQGPVRLRTGKQDWARQMAALLIEARNAAQDARPEGKTVLDAGILDSLTGRYRALAAVGLAANVYRRHARR